MESSGTVNIKLWILQSSLSYQAFRAFKTHMGPPSDFPVDCDTSVYEGRYKKERAKFKAELIKAIEAECAENEYRGHNW
jgi:hypothetical protein